MKFEKHAYRKESSGGGARNPLILLCGWLFLYEGVLDGFETQQHQGTKEEQE